MMTVKELLERFIENNFNSYLDYYINEHDTLMALKKSFDNDWDFETCKNTFNKSRPGYTLPHFLNY